MKISYHWIKEILPDLQASPTELADMLSMIGLEVEAIQDLSEGLDQVVVAKIISAEKHPEADKLKLCKVSDGSEEFQIVCGAPNAEAGKYYPLAKIGAKLPNGLKIKPAKIRKVESFGMLCSAGELGLVSDQDGILELNPQEDSDLGSDFSKFYNLDDIIIEIGITPNRGDCLSHIGVARDISAYYDLELNPSFEVADYKTIDPIGDQLKVNLIDQDQCYRYGSRLISDVVVKDSPQWLKSKLETIGLRPINNIVDATNYVMMLTGHPVHAFDYNKIDGKEIKIQTLSVSEKFKTLDGEERELIDGDLVISDAQKIIALAGIMGGENSQIDSNTKTIALEVASFNPTTIRKTAKRLALSTDSSYRFERVVSKDGVSDVLELLTSLICSLSSGKASSDFLDQGKKDPDFISVKLRSSEVKRLLGTDISIDWISDKLNRLGLNPEIQGDGIETSVPSFRPDLTREIDLIEEIIRFYGFDKVTSSLPAFALRSSYQSQDSIYEDQIKSFLIDQGFQEVIHLNFSSSQQEESLGNLEKAIKLKNPLSADAGYLRSSLFPNLIECLQKNSKTNSNLSKYFELRTTYQKDKEGILTLSGILGGESKLTHWSGQNSSLDFYKVKGLIRQFLDKFKSKPLKEISGSDISFIHPNQSLTYKDRENTLGFLGKVHPKVQDLYDLRGDAYYFEFDFHKLVNLLNFKLLKYKDFSQFPKIERDLTIVVDSGLDYQQIIDNITSSKVSCLSKVELFDVYEGEKLESGKKSFSFSLVFEDLNRTLTDEEVNQSFLKLFGILEKKLGASLREA